ncbi:MAG TPA: fused MFS/spermidine synthase [Longimicrobiaceae bacterium]|nr:fused MFS/spermidine synthase [Longimicrobiaceae bacterium]
MSTVRRGYRRGTLLMLSFASGFGILVLELAGARLLAASYGLSSIPWTAVIAVVLTGLAVGNAAGGRAADRWRPSPAHLFLAAGAWGVVPLAGADLPDLLMTRLGFASGALASAGIFFLVPSALMGAVTPILVQRGTRHLDEVGRRYGDIGAWSTAGAIAGTFCTGFILLPHLPLDLVLGLASSFFFLAATFSAWSDSLRGRTAAGILLLPVPLILAGMRKPEQGTVFTGQSAYAALHVVDRDWYGDVPVREFWQNGSLSSAEHRVTGEPTQFYKITLGWLLSERLERIESVLVLGGAANTFPTQLKRMQPRLNVVVVEIDPRAVTIARKFFSFGALPPDAIEMRVEDARPFLARETRKYDVVVADVYDHLYSVPWPLVTREAFGAMGARLRPGGVLTVTLSSPLEGPGAVFLKRIVFTLETVFDHIRVYPTRPEFGADVTQEVILLAARREADMPAADWPWLRIGGEGPPLSDDFAPVEFLQALRFLHEPR